MNGKSIDDITVGDHAEVAKTISESDVYTFAGVTGDFNPAHVNEHYASGTFFKRRIAHGMLSAGLISNVLGTHLPGPGAVYLSQELKFTAPVYIGDTITARAEVVEVLAEKNRVILQTVCTNQDGTVVITGTALMSPMKKKAAAQAS
ncbi:MaoC family dehydratase [Desulfoluna spongiiphila]|uniref:3-hydroxybutyryl-CoA dehydratase n=1 Tax=Desulfoluna spongiiphila TaxID=419481 RepID=A0A1G5J885_9BACT|nr:MaoC family dehydratase [Desulfoluna spongiiphila]SCY84566.1 3-hydroxybutyryl-CoA dehydratase [Desulfoluna spongiiphila]VVS91029.1 hotdog domain superfamily [Desulfoluna spongiiphila]